MKEREVAVGGRGVRFLRHVRSRGPELLIAAGGLLFALLSRGRHANLTEDHGFWFSAAQSMLSGGRAMHEVRVQYGPVSLWVLEGLCRVFGTSAGTLVIGQFAVGLAAVLGVQILARQFLSPVERWLSAAILVALIVWMAGPGNLLYPCAFARSHALLLAVATLLVHGFFLRRGAWQLSAVSGALAALTVLTKQEFGVAAALGIAAMTALSPALNVRTKTVALAASAAVFAAAYAGILEIARHGDSFRHLVDSNLLWPWAPVPGPWRQLFLRYLGLDAPSQRLREAVDSLAAVAAFGGTAWLALHFRHVARKAAVGVAVVLAWLLWYWRWTEGGHFLPMTLVLPAIACSTIVVLGLWQKVGVQNPVVVVSQDQSRAFLDSRFRGNDTVLPDPPSPPEPASPKPLAKAGEGGRGVRFRRDLGTFCAVAAGALVLLQREGYRGGIEGYYSGMGYVLAVPVVVPLLWRLAKGPAGSRFGGFAAATVLFAVFAWFGIGRLRALERTWKDSVPFETDRGRLYVPSGMAPTINATADFIRQHTKPKDPILILPSTYALDFMLDRVNLAFFPYVSPGFLTPEGEEELIARCRHSPPRAAVVFEHTLGLLRSGDFDNGFATSLVASLRANLPAEEAFSFPGGRRGVRFR